MVDILLALITWTVRAQIVALGLQTRIEDLLYLWRRPGLLLRSLLAMYVVVPIAAVLMVKIVPLPAPTTIALLVLAISAGAPLVPRKLLEAGGDPPYVFSLAVCSSVLAIATVPLSVEILGRLSGRDVGIDPWSVAGVIGRTFLGPFFLGVVIRLLFQATADRIASPFANLASALFTVCAVLVIAFAFKLILRAGLASFVALGGLTLLALLIGHALGGPRPQDRLALGILCASRHVGLAMVLAATVKNRATVAAIGAYILAGLLVSIPYVRWARPRASPPEGTLQPGAATSS